MAYYYNTSTQQNTNGTANTDTFLLNIHTIAGLRAYFQKLVVGTYTTPADNQVRVRLQRTTTLLTAGTGITPTPAVADVVAASAVCTTLPTGGVLNAVPLVQLGYNQRGTAMWAAFNPDEALGMIGATAPNGELVVNSQSTGTSVPVTVQIQHCE